MDLEQNPEAHHKHLHCIRSDMLITKDQLLPVSQVGFKPVKSFFLSQLIQHQQTYFYPAVQECFQKHQEDGSKKLSKSRSLKASLDYQIFIKVTSHFM